MRFPPARILFVVPLVLSACLAGCLDPYRRIPRPRELQTVFSPLDWPTPNSIRTASGLPGPDYWQQRVDYKIDATLDVEARTVHATARITYTNNSPNELDILWFYFEQNLYKEGSKGLRASPLSKESTFLVQFVPFAPGGFRIEQARCNGQDCDLNIYDTVGRIDLPEPIPPAGGTANVEFAWSFVVPPTEIGGRMGVEETEEGPVFAIAQWYPTACVYDDVHGWNTLPYLGLGEFYSNFGSFDVRITVPRDHVVVATGVLHNPSEVLTAEQTERLATARQTRETTFIRRPEEVGDPATRPPGDGPLTWHFVAHDVRTFAWASSAAFIWDAASIPDRGQTPAEESGAVTDLPRGTLVQSVYPKEALPLWQQSTDMLRFSIEHYSEHWLAYPYPVATNVNALATTGVGMEYPMIIFCGEREDEQKLYFVTTHEIGHNWFPMVVNTDERRYMWMDEGFNTFINLDSLRARYPDEPTILETMKPQILMGLEFMGYNPIMTYADHAPFEIVGLTQFARCAWGMLSLRELVLGPERFDDAFRRYIHAWAFKSPQPADFFRCVENAAGEDLAWFWRGWFYETGMLDQAVARVRQPGRDGKVHVTFHNHGEVVMPVVYRVTYRDGSTEVRRLPVEAWFSTDRWTTSWDAGGRRVKEIVIDPDQILPDTNRGNNRWTSWW